MTGYLTDAQLAQLLKPINPKRVSQRDGMSHLEAYDVRAHLDRVFGFARWSADVLDVTLLFEQECMVGKAPNQRPGWRVGYRATVRLTVCAPDGTELATYTECATGDGTMPDSKRADAHDFAIKTSESQALKRCAINLGDQYGLSLYRKGSTAPLVGAVIPSMHVTHDPANPGPAPDDDVTAHITEQLPPETVETTDAEPGEGPVSVNSPPPAHTTPADAREGDRHADVERFRDLILAPAKGNRNLHYAKLTSVVAKAGLLTAVTADGNGEPVTLKRLIDQRMAEAAETSKARTPYKDDEEAVS